MRRKIFLDVETTGLDAQKDKLVELSYGELFQPIKTLYFGVTEVPDFIDNLIGFTARGISGLKSSDEEIEEFLRITEGQTMVSANPKFDAGFLETNGLYKFGYRTLDIESYAMAILELEDVPGMKDLFEYYEAKGIEISRPDHTSAGDVKAMQEIFTHLEAHRSAIHFLADIKRKGL